MKECNIVKDLIPLYAEELTSSDSGEFIENHLSSCAQCREIWRRYREELPKLEVVEDMVENYKKPLKQSVMKVILTTVGAVIVALLLTGYLLWELGYLGEEKIIESRLGGSNFRIQYYNDDGFFIQGGAYVVLPDGTGRNLRGDETFVDLHVWWAPNGEAFFAWWEFTDHDEAYIVDYRDVEAAGGWKNYKEKRDMYSENLFRELEEICTHVNLTVSDMEFVEWSDDGRYAYFRYQAGEENGWLKYHLDTKQVEFCGIVQVIDIPVTVIEGWMTQK